MKSHRLIVRLLPLAIGLVLFAMLTGCSNADKEKALQAQVEQMQSEKTTTEQAKQALQAQIEQMRSEKAAADEANKEKEQHLRLVGTWRNIEGNTVTYKHITPTSWALIAVDTNTGQVTRTKGGLYTLQGNTYIETFEYDSMASSTYRPSGHSIFVCTIDGDTWHHTDTGTPYTDPQTGKQTTTHFMDETWQRVK